MTRKSKFMKWVNTMLKCKVDSYPSQKNPKWNCRHRSWLCTIHEPIDCTRCIESSPLIIYDDSFDGRSLIHMFLLAGLGTLLFFLFFVDSWIFCRQLVLLSFWSALYNGARWAVPILPQFRGPSCPKPNFSQMTPYTIFKEFDQIKHHLGAMLRCLVVIIT